jgi:hypothetical protein
LTDPNALKHTWNGEKKISDVDCLGAFMKINKTPSGRKPEVLCPAIAEGLDRRKAAHFNLLAAVLEEHDLFDRPHNVYNMVESGFPDKNRPQKLLLKMENGKLFH